MLWLRMIAILNIWGFDLKKVSVLVEKKKDASSLHQCTSKVVHCMLGQNLLIWPLGQISSNISTCDAWRTFSVLRLFQGATHNPQPHPKTHPCWEDCHLNLFCLQCGKPNAINNPNNHHFYGWDENNPHMVVVYGSQAFPCYRQTRSRSPQGWKNANAMPCFVGDTTGVMALLWLNILVQNARIHRIPGQKPTSVATEKSYFALSCILGHTQTMIKNMDIYIYI